MDLRAAVMATSTKLLSCSLSDNLAPLAPEMEPPSGEPDSPRHRLCPQLGRRSMHWSRF